VTNAPAYFGETLTTEKKGFCPFQQVDFKVPKIECFDAEEIPYTDCVDAEKIQMTTSMVCQVTVSHPYSDQIIHKRKTYDSLLFFNI
jgi:hypothetical protein